MWVSSEVRAARNAAMSTGIEDGDRRGALWSVGVLIAVLISVLAPQTADAAFSTSLTFAPSTYQAAAHPDLVVTNNFPGSPDVKSLTLTMPNGLRIAPAAVASPCTLANFVAGSCDPS